MKRIWCSPTIAGESSYYDDIYYTYQAVKFSALGKTHVRRLILNVSSTPTISLGSFDADYLRAIYVPDNLVDTIKVSTTWATYAAKIKPLSEYPDY